jgi:DUF4097 and DUF4098 domain-containing protein YvlB
MIRLTAAVLLATLASSCVISLGGRSDRIRVNGVRLDEKHVETILPGPWEASGLTIESNQGDVRIDPTEGPNRIVVTLHEVEPGDAHAAFEGGRLLSRSATGRETAIGEVHVFTSSALPTLQIWTGLGDIDMHGVHVESEILLNTGLGDISLCCAGEPEKGILSTGLGDIHVETTAFTTLEAGTGLGDVEIGEITALEACLSTGLGDVEIEGCTIDRLDASTGLGDVDCRGSSSEGANLSTGLGKVRRR